MFCIPWIYVCCQVVFPSFTLSINYKKSIQTLWLPTDRVDYSSPHSPSCWSLVQSLVYVLNWSSGWCVQQLAPLLCYADASTQALTALTWHTILSANQCSALLDKSSCSTDSYYTFFVRIMLPKICFTISSKSLSWCLLGITRNDLG